MTLRRQRFLRLESFVLTIVFLLCMSAPVYASSHDLPIEYLWNEYDYMKPQQLLYNALPHEYLAGYYSEDGSEITITGMKVTELNDGTEHYVYRKDIVIPDEIDGVPVTTIAESAFEYYADLHCIEAIYYPNKEAVTLKLGRNICHVERCAFSNINDVLVGKYDFDDYKGFYGAHHISCYPDSGMHQAITQTSPFNEFYIYTEMMYGYSVGYSFIDESRLVSDTVEIDAYGNVRLPLGVTKETLENYVSVDGDATIRVVGDTIETGTQIELVNSTYGTIDNTYTVMLADAQIAITAKSQHIAYTGTAIPFVTAVQTTGSPYTLSYTSDNPDVATVDEDGKIHAQKAGTATVTVTAVCENGATQSADCAVTIVDRAYLTSTERIDTVNQIIYLPYGATKETLENSVTLHGDATMVLSDEKVTTGTQIKLVNNTFGTTDMVYTVKREEPKITVTAEEEHIAYVGETFRLNSTVQTNGTPCEFHYSVSYLDVSVDENGIFKAKRPGTSYIYVEAIDQMGFYSSNSVSCRLIVIPRAKLISDTVEIDKGLNVHIPYGMSKQDLEDCVSVDGDATLRVVGDSIVNGTQIELVNNTYGTIDNTYTIVMDAPEMSLSVAPQHTAYAETTFHLDATVQTSGKPCTLTYTSDNPDVAAVDANGSVTTKQSGTATVTVTATDECGFTQSAVCTVTVIDRAHLVSDTAEIDESGNVHLPFGVTKETLETYVSVDGNATIRVVGGTIADGTQIELVNNTYGTIDNTYTVVLEAPQITLSTEPQYTVYAKTSFHLDAAVQTNGTPCTLTYTSDNPDVAAVDKNGSVTANKSGTATITVTATDECGFTQSAVCTVTVKYTWWQWLLRIFLFGWLWY